MLTLVSTGIYLGLIFVLSAMVMRERRRAQTAARLAARRLPYNMACGNR
jgi:hypothetical protein